MTRRPVVSTVSFPLAVDMPVALADHLDRSSEKQLLKGTVGHVHSWVLHPDERSEETPPGVPRLLSHRPKAIFVQFPTGASATPARSTAEAGCGADATRTEASSEEDDGVGQSTSAETGARGGWRLPGLRTPGLYLARFLRSDKAPFYITVSGLQQARLKP